MSTHSAAFQTLIDEALLKGIAPGFQAAVFDADQILFNGVSGHPSLPSIEDPKGREMSHSTRNIDHEVIEEFDKPDWPNVKKVMKLRDVRNKITLRMLLIHTADFAAGGGWTRNNRLISTTSKFVITDMPLYIREDGPEEGHAYPPEGMLWTSIRAFVPLLQAMLGRDERILKSEIWERVTKDDLKDRGVIVHNPYMESLIIYAS
ncbi:hypothetical protein Clacol_006177 [Clathrus columnatus]|uniref:Uncharacterized protein n=1 Tax=Clathrus columnatus TaxID=1419009 RepID=A0AAV5ABE3_9AGAM|nr:hypothetical protein Clacol_006177 [Clathrus columnatus]